MPLDWSQPLAIGTFYDTIMKPAPVPKWRGYFLLAMFRAMSATENLNAAGILVEERKNTRSLHASSIMQLCRSAFGQPLTTKATGCQPWHTTGLPNNRWHPEMAAT